MEERTVPEHNETLESRGYRDGLSGIQPTHPKHKEYMHGWNIGNEQRKKEEEGDTIYLDAHDLRHHLEP
jgi:hypothetical protein